MSAGSDNADGTHAILSAAQKVVCSNLMKCMQCHCHGLQHIPSKKPLEQKVLGPHNAVNRLVRRVADGAYRIRLGCLLGLALKTFSLASQVHSCLHHAQSLVGQIVNDLLQIGACLFSLDVQKEIQVQDVHAVSSFAEHVDCALWEVGMC